MSTRLSPKQRAVLRSALVVGAIAAAGGFYLWYVTRPYETHEGAETRWHAGGRDRAVSVRVTDNAGLPIPDVIVRGFGGSSTAPIDATTTPEGRAELHVGSGRLNRLMINGVDLFSRDGWTAPSTDEGLIVGVTVLNADMMRIHSLDADAEETSADIQAQLDALEATLRDPDGEWLMAWRMLSNYDEPGWIRIERNLFDLSPETEHLRRMALFIDPSSRLTGPIYAHYTQTLAERADDESWAMAWARALLADPDTAESVGPPWIGNYANPIDARLDVAFARVAYGKRFGYVWDGQPDEQQAALARWRDFLEQTDDGEAIDPVVSRRRSVRDRFYRERGFEPPPLDFPGLPRLDPDGRVEPEPDPPIEPEPGA